MSSLKTMSYARWHALVRREMRHCGGARLPERMVKAVEKRFACSFLPGR